MDDIQRFEGGFLLTNCYLTPTPGGGWVLIDAPMGALQWLAELEIQPLALILTHQHFDHVMSAAEVSALGVPIYAWKPFDRSLTLEDIVRQWGMPFDVQAYEVDHLLENQSSVEIDGLTLELSHLPGHSSDSIVLHDPAHGALFAGDTLFQGSTGRTDFPGGDSEMLYRGIREKIYTLGPDVRVLPGHGPETTVGAEAASNPVIRAS